MSERLVSWINLAVLVACWLLIISVNSSVAKEWHGIVPLRSTREDVRKRLGTPNRQYEIFDDYDLDGYSVSILYASDDCDGPLRYWWGNYRVSPGNVLSITVQFDDPVPLTKFKIPDMRKLTKGEPDHTLAVDYFDAKSGIQYSVRDKKVIGLSMDRPRQILIYAVFRNNPRPIVMQPNKLGAASP